MNRRIMIVAVAAACSSSIPTSLQAQEIKSTNAAPPLQQQIDELREGQQRMLKELDEIKKLLQEKSGRVDYAIRPTVSGPISLNVHGELYRGSNRARVAIIEYSDFECSFCARYVREIYPQIEKEYVGTGKIKYFFRDLPGIGDTNALLKARAARCAGEQEKFWEMHDRLFGTQGDTSGRNMESHAQALGMDTQKLDACLASGRYLENIRMSMAGARKIGLYGTPAFLIGTLSEDGDFVVTTKILVGGESFEPIKSAVDEALETASKK